MERERTFMIVDFILLLIDALLTFLEHLFHSGGFRSRRRVRKSLERRRAGRSEGPAS
ncbi:hypothetical protein [Arthrobacter sp. ISL-5]|uniref:hypothetical protein n=1 Tax=Arthrobacter sp. ISL-5 TaxID=2819111 RepID=UPI001BE7986E|nr:hypothetical protein [Arthrobacter sp. ISL-5]MBT2552400.1 hypothetical protein [Arthrobacter sp. ISL-5]